MSTKKKSKEVSKLINFKTNSKDRARLQANADKYTNGNVGEWLRLTAADPRWLKSNRIRVRKALPKAA